MSISQARSPNLNRSRRKNCWWEPTYNPSLASSLKHGTWNLENRGPSGFLFFGEEFVVTIEERKFPSKVPGFKFHQCDFQGFFEPKYQVVFEKCDFIECDFGLSTWRNIKFSKCTFDKSSLSQSIFRRCEFRDCTWVDVGLSPNETEFYDTFINKSWQCVSSAYTNLDADVLEMNNADARYQRMKLATTKSTISRILLNNNSVTADEETYYESVKTYELHQAKGRMIKSIFRAFYDKKASIRDRIKPFFGTIFWCLEVPILYVFGLVNGWGASLLRPLLYLVLTTIACGWLYNSFSATIDAGGFQRAFDISLLAGYSNYSEEKNAALNGLQNINLLLAIIFYTIFFATASSRFSRAR